MRRAGLVLLSACVLAFALWFVLGGGGEPHDPLEGGPSLLDDPDAGGSDPALHGGGELPDGSGGGGALTTEVSDPGSGARRDGPLRLHGRVVDERRRPVVGAKVTLQIGTRQPVVVASDASGAYEFSLDAGGRGAPRRVSLFARHGAGRVGTVTAWLPPAGGSMLAPPLVLRAAATMRVRVLHAGAPVPQARVAVARRMQGVPVSVATGTADAEGQVTLYGLPPGAVELFATAAGHGRGHVKTTLPRPDATPVDVLLTTERTLEVLVVDATNDQPIQGAEVLPGDARTMPDPHGPGYIPLSTSVRTDRAGRARVVGIDAQDVLYVNARAPGYALTPWWQRPDRGAKPGASEIKIALSRFRTVTFPVQSGEVPVPQDGTALQVELQGVAHAAKARALTAALESGELVVRGLPATAVRGVVLAPGGLQALFEASAGSDSGPLVVFRGTREVRVRAVEPDGSPVTGIHLRLNPLRKAASIAPATTDEDGLAVFSGVGADVVTVHIVAPDQPTAGVLLSKLDLRTDEEVYEVEVQAQVELMLHIRIDDEARLPAAYTLMAGNTRVGPGEIEEDPDAGRLRAWLRPPPAAGAIMVALHADGYLPVSGTIDPSAGGTSSLDLELEPAGRLVVQVQPPADGKFAIRLQRYDEATETWKNAPTASRDLAQLVGPQSGGGQGAEQEIKGLAPGRYRAMDTQTRTFSDAAQVQAGAAPPRVTLDLSGLDWLEGRVVGPPGTELGLARVFVEGRDDPARLWSGTRPDKEGAFRLRAVRGESISLRVSHPLLAPAKTGGRVTVRPGSARVELRLEDSGRVRFRIVGYEDAQSPANGPWYAPVRVHVFPADGGSAPARLVQPRADAGTFEFGGVPAGTWRVVLVFNKDHAPKTFPKVRLEGGSTDLGTVTPTVGETLVFRVRGGAEEGAPTLWASVEHEGAPGYARRAERDPQSGDLRCGGLGAGTFHVVVRGANFAPGSTMSKVLLDKRVTLDGSGETTLDVPLR